MLQNVDRNVSPADYRTFAKDTLLVSKLFHTIQGEGPFGGLPAIFLRLAGCNRGAKAGMGCDFCDTAFQFDKGQVRTFEQLMLAADAARGVNAQPKLWVITGGEPMLQENLPVFIQQLLTREVDVQIESNGDRVLPIPAPVCLVVSPKVVGGKYRRPKEDVLRRADAFKFVIEATPDSPYREIPDWAFWAADGGTQIYISPLAVYARAVVPGEVASAWTDGLLDRQRTAENYHYAARLAMRHGFYLSTQQHLMVAME